MTVNLEDANEDIHTGRRRHEGDEHAASWGVGWPWEVLISERGYHVVPLSGHLVTLFYDVNKKWPDFVPN